MFKRMVLVSRHDYEEIIKVSQKILFVTQNFDTLFPGLENLKHRLP